MVDWSKESCKAPVLDGARSLPSQPWMSLRSCGRYSNTGHRSHLLIYILQSDEAAGLDCLDGFSARVHDQAACRISELDNMPRPAQGLEQSI